MEARGRQSWAEAYSGFLERLLRDELQAGEACPQPLPSESELESLWADGLPGELGGGVQVLDCGEWNRGDGPDFLRAELLIGGRRVRGDVEIDRSADSWELAGHGDDPAYDHVALHVIFSPAPPGWYTRNSQHREIPRLCIPEELWLAASGRRRPLEGMEGEEAPLRDMPLPQLISLLKAAAARRLEDKRQRHRRRSAVVGSEQAWYEALAVTLGYSANKWPMELLARRAPLRELGGEPEQAEAILFGTAGFLAPLLPERATDGARGYHRSVWDAWWPQRAQYELAASRRIPWVMAAGRPLNHPHRRVAALAVAASRWGELFPLMNGEHAHELERAFAGLSHPYWDWHCSLPAAPMERKAALMGRARVREFLVNHVYVQDSSEAAWNTYLCLTAESSPMRVRRTARLLFGLRADVEKLLPLCFVQQGLLQLERDCRTEGGYPAAMRSWQG